jgi:L-lactate dehydrogenase
MSSLHTRISIVGCGHVGTSCAYAILQNHLAREIVLIGDTEHHVQGEALDLQQAVPLGSPIHIFAETYKEAAESAIVIMTVGAPAKFAGSRLDMPADNVVIVRRCVQKLMAEGFDGVLLIATNPVDVLTYIVQKESGLAPSKVIGSGTLVIRSASAIFSVSSSMSARAPSTQPSSANTATPRLQFGALPTSRAFLSHAILERTLFLLTKNC